MQEINASSMADISFLLLIFFLVTTSMSSDKGLSRRLPPPPEPNQELKDQQIKERDIFIVKINSNNDVGIKYNGSDKYEFVNTQNGELRQKVRDFILNPNNSDNLPVLYDTVVVEMGNKTVSYTRDHVISVQNDVDTKYSAFIRVQNELVGAYNEVRDEKAAEYFGKPTFDELNEGQQKVIQKLYPQKISEAEPKNYGGKKDGKN